MDFGTGDEITADVSIIGAAAPMAKPPERVIAETISPLDWGRTILKIV